MRDKYIVVKYLRLSSEDGDKPESDSISNQRDLLDCHIKKLFEGRSIETMELVDDGYSGTNLNRPGIRKLLTLAETHVINCVMVKDFSRFARDYIEAGRYVEQKFPEWQIRFISINDNYDSQDYTGTTGGIEVALKNIAYTMYSMDLSEKIKSSRKTLYKQGKNIAPYAFYGYVKDPNNKHRIVIDESAAAVVKRIFNLRSCGKSAIEIAKLLNSDKIPTPAQYKKLQFPECGTWERFDDYKQWTSQMVRGLLRDERYTGKYIGAKNERVSIGSNKHRRLKAEDRTEINNAHEAIISAKQYQSVQPSTHGGKKPKSGKGILRGLVHCGGCGHSMSAYGNSDETVKYYCPYRTYSDYNNCCTQTLSDSELAQIVIKIIQNEIFKAVSAEKTDKKIKSKLCSRMNTADMLRRRIEDRTKEKIKHYMKLAKGEYSEDTLNAKIQNINNDISKLKERLAEAEISIKSIKELSFETVLAKYIETAQKNREFIRDLIKAVYVYEDREIKIVWKVLGTQL